MKRTITVVGAGHVSGKKKNGQPFKFYEINGTYVDERVEGLRCIAYAVFNEEVLDDAIIRPGEQLNVWSHFWNGSEYVDAVLNV